MRTWQIYVFAFGVFSIINAEMGVVGILPALAEHYEVSISTAGLTVSLFALAIVFAGPTMPLLASRFPRRWAMSTVLAVFTVGSLIAAFTTNFAVLLATRILSGIFQPVYTSMAFSLAAEATDDPTQTPRVVAKITLGVSAGMVLGVPIASAIVDTTTVQVGLLFFAACNALALVATWVAVPTHSRSTALSYGSQLQYLARAKTWKSTLAVVCLNGAIFGVYSYFSEYLAAVSRLDSLTITWVLFVYGLANMLGNVLGGRALSLNPRRLVTFYPLSVALIFGGLWLFAKISLLAIILVSLLGVFAGIALNINQFWITNAMPQAPEFANGLFLSATNLGTTIATSINGMLIAAIGTNSIVLGGLVMLIPAVALFLWRTIPEGRGKTSQSATS